MTVGPTAEALARQKRAAIGRRREKEDFRAPRADTAVFATVLNVCLVGVVGLAVLGEAAGVGR